MTYRRNYERYYNFLSNKYAKEIIISCNEQNNNLRNCLILNNSNNEICEFELGHFKNCVEHFDEQFKLKHKIRMGYK